MFNFLASRFLLLLWDCNLLTGKKGCCFLGRGGWAGFVGIHISRRRHCLRESNGLPDDWPLFRRRCIVVRDGWHLEVAIIVVIWARESSLGLSNVSRQILELTDDHTGRGDDSLLLLQENEGKLELRPIGPHEESSPPPLPLTSVKSRRAMVSRGGQSRLQ